MTQTQSAHLPTQGLGWTARLELGFARREGQTFLAHRRHVGPLVVQRPFYPEGETCHVYIVHPPGGVVGTDDLTIEVDAQPASHALLTTPAATKFYRCESSYARQTLRIASRDAAVEWLPQETIFYPGSLARSETIVQLYGSSRFIGWEIPCLGLPARGEAFDRGELRLNLEIWANDKPLLVDRLRIDGSHAARRAVWGLSGFTAIGTLIAYPADRALLECLRQLTHEDSEFAVSIVDEVLVCRALAHQAATIKRVFLSAWQRLRPSMMGKPALAPRIWAT